MLPESRLYSFIDQREDLGELTLHFLEGQKLIHDLAIIHNLRSGGFHFFRDTVLSLIHLISFLKPGEGLGIYIDSEEPYFRFKIEFSEEGQMRTLLIPEEFNEFPKKISGNCRVAKTLPDETHPYVSIIALKNTDHSEIVNLIFKESYQTKGQVFLSDSSDQSVMLLKLPRANINKIETNDRPTIDECWSRIKNTLESIFLHGPTKQLDIQLPLESTGLLFLGSKEIKFKCTCSRERMLYGISLIVKNHGIDHVFANNEDYIEAKCDYCKSNYSISKAEF